MWLTLLNIYSSITSVGSQDYSHPVEGICWIWRHDAKKRNLYKEKRHKTVSQNTYRNSRLVVIRINKILTWQHTRKMNSVMAVHSTFSLNWIWKRNRCHLYLLIYEYRHNATCVKRLTFLSGFWISGKTAQNGLITSKNLTAERKRKAGLKDRHCISTTLICVSLSCCRCSC